MDFIWLSELFAEAVSSGIIAGIPEELLFVMVFQMTSGIIKLAGTRCRKITDDEIINLGLSIMWNGIAGKISSDNTEYLQT